MAVEEETVDYDDLHLGLHLAALPDDGLRLLGEPAAQVRTGQVLFLVPHLRLHGEQPHLLQELLVHLQHDRVRGGGVVSAEAEPGLGQVPGAGPPDAETGRGVLFTRMSPSGSAALGT